MSLLGLIFFSMVASFCSSAAPLRFLFPAPPLSRMASCARPPACSRVEAMGTLRAAIAHSTVEKIAAHARSERIVPLRITMLKYQGQRGPKGCSHLPIQSSIPQPVHARPRFCYAGNEDAPRLTTSSSTGFGSPVSYGSASDQKPRVEERRREGGLFLERDTEESSAALNGEHIKGPQVCEGPGKAAAGWVSAGGR
jgi:hypothetical protein